MEKKIAVCALVWILVTLFWVWKAAKDGVPLSYGVIASIFTCVIGFTIGWLLTIAFG